MSDIERLRMVATVARTHSMSEAARIHGVAQSTVTRSVAAAEHLVGFALFQRRADGVLLAPGAKEAVAVINRIAGAFDELAALKGARPAAIRFAYGDAVPIPAMLDSAIARWNRQHPLQAVPVRVESPVAALRARDVEFAVVQVEGSIDGLVGEPIKILRGVRIDLLSTPSPTAEVAEFLRFLG